MEGKVEGTLSKQLRDENEKGVEVVTSLEGADASLDMWDNDGEQDLFSESDDETPKNKSKNGRRNK